MAVVAITGASAGVGRATAIAFGARGDSVALIAREPEQLEAALADVRRAAEGSANLLPPMRAALARLATVGEVCGVLRQAWGEYHPDVRV